MSRVKTGTVLMAAAALAIAATVTAAILVMGSPGVQRERSIDARRVQDLQRIQHQVEAHYSEHGVLPRDLATLAAKPGIAFATADPVTATAYGYQATGRLEYQLCATFATDSAADNERRAPWTAAPDWAHGAGRTCFTRRVQSRAGND